MSSFNSYPSIYACGHKAMKPLLHTSLTVEEKIDGSQLNFGISNGVLRVKSKGAEIYPDAPEKMFAAGVAAIKDRLHLLHDGWTYRGEYLKSPKHNALAYDRIPHGHIIIFDVSTDEETYLLPGARVLEANRVGFECVPVLGTIIPTSSLMDDLKKFLDMTSILGGQKVEGVVLKPFDYAVFGVDKKVLMAKFVSEAFKEVHKGAWRDANPSRSDIIQRIIADYKTPARWHKAILHLRERGQLESSPRDIGKLIKEVPLDILKEEEQAIKDALFGYAWPQIKRGVVAGFPEWYKELLVGEQVGGLNDTNKG